MVSLYRKYRPLTFDEVIGQDHITITLTNQIKSGRIRHAYLFTGSRGTGKTTSARIFASAVNCLKPKNGNPCYKCDVCSLLKVNVHADILEIDAASNNKVDEVRALRDTINFAPVSSKYKVYIIDEVHMLTDSAFNALLKTLEEPPAHVIFILGTTESHKLPATILSRCMRFDFHLVERDKLKYHLAGILKKENKTFEEDAIDYIASLAEGSVRDAISLLDTCINFSDGVLTTNAVLEVLGAVDKKKIFELFECVASGDIGNALRISHELEFEGKSMSHLAKELVCHARDLLITKTLGTALVKGTKEHIDYFKLKAGIHSKELLIELIQIFSSIDADLRYAVNPKIVLQASIIKACALILNGKNQAETDVGVTPKQALQQDKSEKKKVVKKVEAVDENFGLEPPPIDIEYNENHRDSSLTPKILSLDINSGQKVTAPASNTSEIPKSLNDNAGIQSTLLKSSQTSNKKDSTDPIPLNSQDIWGKLTTYFRRANDISLYNIVLGKGKDTYIEKNELVVKAFDENFMVLSDPGVHHKINDALKALKFSLRLRVEKVKLDIIDMDKEIANLKEMTEGVRVKISYN